MSIREDLIEDHLDQRAMAIAGMATQIVGAMAAGLAGASSTVTINPAETARAAVDLAIAIESEVESWRQRQPR